MDVAGQGFFFWPLLNTSSEPLFTVDDHQIEVETRTCLALAELYDDPRPNVNNFTVPWDWRQDYEDKPKTNTEQSRTNAPLGGKRRVKQEGDKPS